MSGFWRCVACLLVTVSGTSIAQVKCDPGKKLKVSVSLAHPDEGSDYLYARAFAIEDRLRKAIIGQLSDACIIDVGQFDNEANFPALKGSFAVTISGTTSEKNPEISALAITINRVDRVWGKGAQIILAFPLLIESRDDVIPAATRLANMIRNHDKNGGSGGGRSSP